jgi:hypothetical protein
LTAKLINYEASAAAPANPALGVAGRAAYSAFKRSMSFLLWP